MAVQAKLEKIQVSPEDAHLLEVFNWYCSSEGYARRTTKDKIYLHRLITRAEKGMYVDHINGDRLDNRRENLRVCSRQENIRNCGKRGRNRTGYKGVFITANPDRFEAAITVNNKKVHIGTYSSKVEAAKAYNEAAVKYFGEFARLNEV